MVIKEITIPMLKDKVELIHDKTDQSTNQDSFTQTDYDSSLSSDSSLDPRYNRNHFNDNQVHSSIQPVIPTPYQVWHDIPPTIMYTIPIIPHSNTCNMYFVQVYDNLATKQNHLVYLDMSMVAISSNRPDLILLTVMND